MKKTVLMLLLLMYSLLLFAGSTTYFTNSTIEDFQQGEFDGISINEKNQLHTAPQSSLVFQEHEMFVWDLASNPQGGIYAATGIEGKLYTISGTNAVLVYKAQTLSIKALAVSAGGELYAATSPDAQILLIPQNGEPEKIAEFSETYIWDMTFGPDNRLYVVTGNPARLYSVNTANNSKEMLYEAPGESHFLAVAANSAGAVYFASEGSGILYKRNKAGNVEILFDTYENEISALHIDANGTVYFATASQRRTPLPGNFSYTDTLNTREHEEQATQQNSENEDDEKKLPLKNSIYRIGASNTVEKIFTKENVSFFSLATDADGRLYAGTGDYGVLYMIDSDDTASRVLRLPQSQLLCMLVDKEALYIGTGNNGQVYKLGFNTEYPGNYTSQIFDAHTPARWGGLQWQADVPAGCRIEFYVRSGNTAKPDETWSEWKGPIVRSGAQIPFAHTRFLQYRIIMTGRGTGESPTLDSVTLPFLRDNRPPRVTRIQLFSHKDAENNKELTLQQGQGAVVWFAEDDDSDTLMYSLFFRFASNQQWYMLRDRLSKNSITFYTSMLPDGFYYFKVVASDFPSNSTHRSLTGEETSQRFLIDNNPPAFSNLLARTDGDTIIITGQITDIFSNITAIQYSLNARSWYQLDPADLIFDQKTETIYLKIDRTQNPDLIQGSNAIIIRASDALDNWNTAGMEFHVSLKATDYASSVQQHPFLIDHEE